MEIYYLRKKDFLNSIKLNSLDEFSDGRKYISEEKRLEHLCGLFLTKFVARHFYDVKNDEIVLNGHKPVFKNSKINFSISHSFDVILVAFNNANIGVDVEYMCPRKSFQKIMHRFGRNSSNPSRKEFYKFWTLHEAEIKLGDTVKSLFTSNIDDDYILTCVSNDVLVADVCLKELKCLAGNLDLVEEFNYPKNLNL